MTWHEDFYIWGEVERIRAMKFGEDAELHQDTLIQRMAARIGKPDRGCLLIHAAVEVYFHAQRWEHGNQAIKIAIRYFRDGWFWEDESAERIDKQSMELKGWEIGKLKALVRNYNRLSLSQQRSEAGKKGMRKRWGESAG